MNKQRGERKGGSETAYAIGRSIQLLALIGGSVAFAMTMYVMPFRDKSTAPSLGLALLCGAVFAAGWLIQRHLGRPPNRGS